MRFDHMEDFMRGFLKVFGIILGILLLAVLVFAIINIKSVMLFFGMGRIEVKGYDTVVTSLQESGAFTDIQVTYKEDLEIITCASIDGVVNYVIEGKRGEVVQKIEAKINAKSLKDKDIDYTDVNAVTEQAKEYISPIIAEDQVLGLTGYVAKEAYAQYNQGQREIVIEKDFGGIKVSVQGDTATGELIIRLDTSGT
jgi:hypothetical protein